MSTERRLAELERRVSALANTIRSSPGASTVGGAEFLRAPQMGFPAKLTSVYNATTGYDWEQRTLTSSGGVQDGGDPLTGTRAWEIAGRTDLTSGSYVWLEPAPTGQGYIFSVSDAGSSTRLGWFARLTSSSSGAWKWYKVILNSSGVWVDSGSEAASFNAYPSEIDPTATCNPMTGQRVWMWTSEESGKYEFMTVLSPPLLCEVTAYDGTTKYHTVKQKTWDDTTDTIVDFSPATTYTKCVSVIESQIATGDRVLMWKIPDRDDEHWIHPVQLPSLVEGTDILGAAFDIGDNTTYQTVTDGGGAYEVTLPSAGSYLVWYQCSAYITGVATDALLSIYTELYNSSDAASITGTERQVVLLPKGVSGIVVQENTGSASSQKVITVAGAKTFKLRAKNSQAYIGSPSTAINSAMLGYVKLSVR